MKDRDDCPSFCNVRNLRADGVYGRVAQRFQQRFEPTTLVGYVGIVKKEHIPARVLSAKQSTARHPEFLFAADIENDPPAGFEVPVKLRARLDEKQTGVVE